ncbi:DUF309 domain-containing protein [Sulfuracidifex metallicus]|uniref:DUF309 domain-containing protein n=1 Tax=Sulfuracidifex metallicus TaxID=47303 RepID=UPI00210D9B46|nr:DUF309 domain-containing protein [Sulfuracidifex metallicus]
MFYKKDVYSFSLKEKLRRGSNVIDIRNGLKYLEVDIIGNYDYIINVLGRPLFVSNINEMVTLNFSGKGDFGRCMNSLSLNGDPKQTENSRTFYQGLILVCASMIKFNKGENEISDKLMESALRLFLRVSDSKINAGLKALYGE